MRPITAAVCAAATLGLASTAFFLGRTTAPSARPTAASLLLASMAEPRDPASHTHSHTEMTPHTETAHEHSREHMTTHAQPDDDHGHGHGHESGPSMEDAMNMDPAQIMEIMRAAAEPGEHHKHLAKLAGRYDCTLAFKMDPSAPAEVSQGTCNNKLILGGRYLLSEFKGSFKFGGQDVAFEGVGILGYDKNTDQLTSVWCDSMNTAVQVMQGTCDANGEKLTFEGKTSTPFGESKMKNVYKIPGDGTHTMEFWEPNPMTGEMMQTGTIVYTPKAG